MSRSKKDDLVFKALANNDRRKILDLLKNYDKTTGEICKEFKNLDRCTVLQHLRVLENAELVITRRDGRQKWNYLNISPIQGIYNRWIKSYAAPAADMLTRLKSDLESTRQE